MRKNIFLLLCSFSLMSENINWQFPPEEISSPGQNAQNPSIAIDSNGNAIAIWLENGLVKTRSRLSDMAWDSTTVLSGIGSSSPRIVTDSNGNSTAIWIENGLVKSASKTLNAGWSSPVSLSGSNAAFPTIVVDRVGNVIVGWSRSGDIQTSTKPFGGNWQSVASINGTGFVQPHIAIGGSGSATRASIVWQGVANGVNVVYGATKLISTSSWGSKQIISDTSHQAGYAKVAVDSKGNTTALWFAYDLAGPDYYQVKVESAYRAVNDNWSNFSTLSEAGLGNPANLALRVKCDESGNVIALWSTTFDNENYSIQSAVKPVFGSWASPKNLVGSNLYAYDANLTVASLGDALALYVFYNGSDLIIQSSEMDITGFMDSSWALPQNLSQGVGNAYPSVSASVNGETVYTAASWVGANGINNSVLASMGKKSIVAPPSNLSVLQSSNYFGVLTEYYNTLTWDAVLNPNVVGYLIYRNGVFLAQVGADVLEFIDNNKVQNGPVVYGVAAVDNQQSHSQITTISFP